MASIGLATTSRKSLAMGPSVRNLLRQYQLNPNQIVSTGPHQTLIKSDVLAHLSKRQLQPAKVSAPKYPRRTLTSLEIEVINSGGVMN